jgi:L-lactate dehydrogenase complex protein LldG
MSSREKILKEIAKNKPSLVPLPSIDFERSVPGSVQHYLEVLHSIGGKGKMVDGWHEVLYCLQQKFSEGLEVANAIPKLAPYNIDAYITKSREEIQSVHTVFLQGEVAVAENAAIWVPEQNMGNRMLPFICEELVLVINEADVVATMHDAYSRISTDEDGYGVFIAGPSKTADIEQSLVIGAHGPLRLQVFVLAASSNPSEGGT